MKETVHILYPDDRMVSEEKIIGWAKDLWDDIGELGRVPLNMGLEEAKDFLQDMGEVTFASS